MPSKWMYPQKNVYSVAFIRLQLPLAYIFLASPRGLFARAVITDPRTSCVVALFDANVFCLVPAAAYFLSVL